MEKRCGRCNEIQSVDNFHKDKNRGDGLYPICKNCRKKYEEKTKENISKYHKEHYQRNRNKIVEYIKNYRNTHVGYDVESKKKYKKTDKGKINNSKFPEKTKARIAVFRATVMGVIPKAKKLICCICQKKQAEHYHHHNGYNIEHHLDVIPVCSTCHKFVEHHK